MTHAPVAARERGGIIFLAVLADTMNARGRDA